MDFFFHCIRLWWLCPQTAKTPLYENTIMHPMATLNQDTLVLIKTTHKFNSKGKNKIFHTSLTDIFPIFKHKLT